VIPYPPEKPGTPPPEELAELLKWQLIRLDHVAPLLRDILARIEALEARQDWLRNVVDPEAD
jgi:hypothetical protein